MAAPRKRRRAPVLARIAAAAAGALDSVSSPDAERRAARALPPITIDSEAPMREPTDDELRAVAVSSEAICERAREIKSENERRSYYERLERRKARLKEAKDAGATDEQLAELGHAFDADPKAIKATVVWADCLSHAERALRREIWFAGVERPRIIAEGQSAERELDGTFGSRAVRSFNSQEAGLEGGNVLPKSSKPVPARVSGRAG